MRACRVPQAPGDALESRLECRVRERLHLAAVVADEVMVVLAARVHGLEARGAGADVDPLQEALVGQEVEHAVDARDPHPAPLGPELVEDLLRGQAAVLTPEELDDRPAGAAAATAVLDGGEGQLRSVGHRLDHSADNDGNQYR